MTGPYAGDINSLQGTPVNWDDFTLVSPERSLCQLVEPTGMDSSNIQVIEDFNCDLAACVRWCYPDLCTFVMYSPVDHICYRANNLQLTDDSTKFQAYWDAGWIVYRKNTIVDIPYFAGDCSELLPSTCHQDKECAWDKGLKGYNNPTQGGDADGWCGRIKCFAADGPTPAPQPTAA